MLRTRPRSRPRGRGGTGGSSPAAIRSLQSAYNRSARGRPIRLISAAIAGPAPPARMRYSQASTDESKSSRSSIGISRVALFPSWWQSWQPSFSRSTQSAWVRMATPMPLPRGPVPGKSPAGGTSSSEYQ